MSDLRIANTANTNRIESDREVLPFPRGGVFGYARGVAPRTDVSEIERTLGTMKQQLDQLSDAVDEVLKFSEYVDTDENSPNSAA